MTATSRLRRASLSVWLLIYSIIIIYALAYPPNPNRIIETWLFSLLAYHCFPRLWQGVLWLSVPIILLYHPTATLYGRPSFGIVASLISTTASETTEFLSTISWQTYIASIVLALLPLGTLYWCRRQPGNRWHWYQSLPVLLIIGAMSLSTAQKGYTVGGFALRVQPLEFMADAYLQPKAYFAELDKLKVNIDKPDQWQIQQVQQHYKNYVLIIGESARADYHHLYGFKYPNTPFMDQHASLIMDNMLSAGPNTPISLLNDLTLSHGHGINIQNNIITLAKKAGMSTSWLSNQGALGQYDTSISAVAHQANNVVFLKKTGYDFGDKTFDDQLIPHLTHILNQPSSQNRLIVLHIIGSHPNPCERLSKPAHHYVENMNSNCYIDSIQQTDTLLSQIYQQLQQTNQPFSLLYFSDHGLSHDKNSYEKNSLVRSASILRHNDRFYQNYHVPLVIINSDQQNLVHNPAHRSGLYLIDGLAAWLGIDSPQLPYSKTFFSHQDSENIQVFGLDQQLKSINALKDDPLPSDLQ
ncbi:phosphoethanolamine transferase [Neisseriaceae bacterium ESL0693]|nr:phosphoethanolamine transferase [Neisseriaceae bacterium ESL0693]